MEKSVDEIAEEENVNFIKIDVDQFEELATKQYNVTSVPTLLYLKNGKVTAKLEGFKGGDPRTETGSVLVLVPEKFRNLGKKFQNLGPDLDSLRSVDPFSKQNLNSKIGLWTINKNHFLLISVSE